MHKGNTGENTGTYDESFQTIRLEIEIETV